MKARRFMNEASGLKRLIDIKGAANYTGLSVHTVYTMVSQKRIPYVKVGRLVKFDLNMLDSWIKQHTVMPMPERRP
jgi:excisionase family DNA binding protein